MSKEKSSRYCVEIEYNSYQMLAKHNGEIVDLFYVGDNCEIGLEQIKEALERAYKLGLTDSFIHTPDGETKKMPTSLFSQLLNKFNASENPNDSMFIFLVAEMGLPFAKQMALILGWNVQNILDYIVAEGLK